MRRVAILLLAVFAVFIANSALATTTLTNADITTDHIQQTSNNPCVIGDPSCNQGNPPLTYSSFSGQPAGQGGNYDLFSPVYQVGTGVSAPNTLPAVFNVGVDDNVAAGAGDEILTGFFVYGCTSTATSSCTTLLYAYNGNYDFIPGPGGNTNNGNGYSDIVINGFNVTGASYIRFEATMNNDTDGMEEYFVIPGTVPTPEPASLLLLGCGLATLAGLSLKRDRK